LYENEIGTLPENINAIQEIEDILEINKDKCVVN